jgi:hypothetical protein
LENKKKIRVFHNLRCAYFAPASSLVNLFTFALALATGGLEFSTLNRGHVTR